MWEAFNASDMFIQPYKQDLKPYDLLMFILSKPPTSVQVSIVDRN
jgi:hypothetical protein